MKPQVRILRESFAIAWILLITAVYLAPALMHGLSLGPFDLLSQYGLTYQPGVPVHNIVGSDEIQALIPWQTLDWLQIHSGHLPLWNSDSLLGMPLAFNMQSSPFSLSVAIGYLFPLHLAHSATVIARMLIASFGMYVFCRTMRLSIFAATMSATIYELCGGFSIWLGSNISDEWSWTGWVFAASVCIMKGTHRARYIVLMTIVLALAFYAGEPQISTVLLTGLAIFVVVTQTKRYRLGDVKGARTCVLDQAGAVLVAFGLAAPLYLPALQLAPGSVRAVYPPISGLPLYDITHFLFATYNGSPITGSQVIGPDNLYVSMLYVGVIGAVLALVGIMGAWRRPEVGALGAIGVLVFLAVFFHPIIALLARIPYAKTSRILVATVLLEFVIAVLAGFGAQALVGVRTGNRVFWHFGVGISLVGAVLIILALRLVMAASHLSLAAQATRWHSFIWPTAQLCACVTVLVMVAKDRSSQSNHAVNWYGVGLLLLVEAGFLVGVGNSIWSSSDVFFAPTKAVSEYKRDVGSSLVAMGSCPSVNAFSGLGIMPNANIAYGVDQLSAYDPLISRAYYASYAAAADSSAPIASPGVFCPGITTMALAREYGVSFVLEPPGRPGPIGMKYVATLAGEGLYRVPDSGRATLSPIGRSPREPSPARVIAVTSPNPTTWRLSVKSAAPSVLQLRLTDVPGWNATIDGQPLRLEVWDGVMLQARVPTGPHVIELHYWPRALSLGLIWAALSVVGLMGLLLIKWAGKQRDSTALSANGFANLMQSIWLRITSGTSVEEEQKGARARGSD
ncbi:MAG TPA: YfhO family protein [Acidimicrobiales bacterium]|nr:YfhO family protein [Acidimicrobiales bacterium]